MCKDVSETLTDKQTYWVRFRNYAWVKVIGTLTRALKSKRADPQEEGERGGGRESSAYFFSSSVKTAVCLLCLRSETGMQARAILSFLTERQGFVRSDPVKMWRNTLSIFGGPLLFCQRPCLTDHTVLGFRRSHHKHTPRGLKTHISYLHGSCRRTSCPNLHWINSQRPFGLRWMRVASIQVSESTGGWGLVCLQPELIHLFELRPWS